MGAAFAEVQKQYEPVLSEQHFECLQSLKDVLTAVGKNEVHLARWASRMIKKISKFEERDDTTDIDKMYFLADLYAEIENRKKNNQISDGHFFDLMEEMSRIEQLS